MRRPSRRDSEAGPIDRETGLGAAGAGGPARDLWLCLGGWRAGSCSLLAPNLGGLDNGDEISYIVSQGAADDPVFGPRCKDQSVTTDR